MLSTVAAIAFLAAVLALPLAAVIAGLVRSRLNPLECLLWGLAYLLVRLLWRATWSGPLPVPEGQGAIIVCNHRSSVDPFFIQTTTGRPVHWMVASEYFGKPFFGWFLRTCQAVPVHRGGSDTAATKTAIRIASQGGLVGMFPEGRINLTEELMLPGRPGAALIALKARALIVPCYIEGAPFDGTMWGPLLTPSRVRVTFGQPLDLAEFYGREGETGVTQEVMRRCLSAIARLAGQPDYQPRLAGRAWKPTAEEITAHLAARNERRRMRAAR
jgi:1-acyl-sn-glycerol-3-phosphate acyltransferase